ncbi:peptide ABC transporter substrate-binding protein [Meiothermus sp. QL-1]|uniref:peptide ABC transporter substrate-binding protein n=1 Tax=Meiothermus sp. QL-1 TaxID=2058095 RepID=UPI000E0A7920|nr:peptide ABC transporter substrate-binding protein [Meiothermus sp. QL-1]RDI96250.1 peptide ABC transporter substrate-binding protein [Meiothermus sp. QL-1]
MKKVALSLWFLAGLALAGPQDNSLVIGAAQEPRALAGDVVNAISNQSIKFEIENFLFAPLVQTNRDLEIIPVVVTEVPTLQNGRVRFTNIRPGVRRLELDYTIRPDAVWSDGRPISTEDVALWFEMGKTKGVPSTAVDFFERATLRVRDGRNFTVVLEPAYFYDLEVNQVNYAPNHIMRQEWERAKAAAAQTSDAARQAEIFRNFFTQFSSPQFLNSGRMVYSGPFTLVRWVPGSSIEMQRNPRFWIKPPGGEDKYVQRVVYRIIQNTNSLLVAILGGGIDAASSVSITFDQARSRQLLSRAPGRFEIWAVSTPFFEHIEINQFSNVQRVRDLMLDNVKTRQALIYAMNREGITKAFFDGLYTVAPTWVSPQNPMFNPNVTRYPYNPERARQLLAELGWRPGPDGILQRTVDGRTVRFELEWATTAGNAVRERIQQFVAENYRQVGIAVRVNNAPSAVLLSAQYRSRAQEGTWTGFLHFAFSMGQADDGVRSACRDDEGRVIYVPTRENGFRGLNFGGWCNEEFDRLRNQAAVEFDVNRRKQLFARMQEIWANEVAMIPLYFVADARVFRSGLVNYVSSTFASSAYPTIEPWLIGWQSRGAQKVYDQAKYGQLIAR